MKNHILASTIAATLMTILLASGIMPAFAADHTNYQVGASGAGASITQNYGLGSWITVKVPQTIVSASTTHYFWPGQYLTSGEFIHDGYEVNVNSQNSAQFWWWVYNADGTTKTGCKQEYIGSASNGVTYDIYMYSSGNTWIFKSGSTTLGQCTLNSNKANNSGNPVAIAEVSSANAIPKNAGNQLGPSNYGYPALEFLDSSSLWHDFPHGTAYYAALNPSGGQSEVCPPYGVVGTAFNKMNDGYNVSCTASGTNLW